MRFSLMTEPQLGGTYDQLLDLARWAESEGMVSFARSDHYYSGREPKPDATDAFATLAGLGRETTSIRLCVLVSPVTFRHPAVIAKTAATIDQMSGGRLDLGVGTGWMDLEHDVFGMPFPEWSERFARLRDALPYLRAAFDQDHASYQGEHYSIDAQVRPRPSGIRLVVGGQGPVKTPTLAGTYADEYNHFPTLPETLAPKIEVLRSAASAAGRDPEGIEITIMGPIITGVNETDFHQRLARMASERATDPDSLVDRWKQSGIPVGAPDEVRTALAALERAGVDRYYLQWIDLDDRQGLETTWNAVKDLAPGHTAS
ncbi:MAG: LLM class flavin-dependent oxidoreductase [Acidimicrobiia bacterium]